MPLGTNCIVRLVNGETVRGAFGGIAGGRLTLRSTDAAGAVTHPSFDHDDVALVARVVKMSKGTRGWVGAAIGAVISVPFGISMIGDMMMPAAIAGALIGRGTGDSRAEVVFERP